jgi:hypothetical protein
VQPQPQQWVPARRIPVYTAPPLARGGILNVPVTDEHEFKRCSLTGGWKC